MAYITIKARVPQEVADAIKEGRLRVGGRSRELSELLKGDYSQLFSQAGVVDIQPADNGATKTQEDWIAKYNAQEGEFKGKKMISAPDVYNAEKTGSEELIGSLRNDFQRYWLVTSTGISYSPDTLDARIVHNRGSTVVQPTEKRIVVPIYEGVPLEAVLETKEGLAYLQALFNTKDKPEKIAQALAALRGKEVNDTYAHTPNQKSRASYPERAAGFEFDLDWFLVNGGSRVDGVNGRSRGVSVKSAKPTRKNKA